jgi:hypothetical protein
MSALGQKRTFALQKHMSALSRKAGIDRCHLPLRLARSSLHAVDWRRRKARSAARCRYIRHPPCAGLRPSLYNHSKLLLQFWRAFWYFERSTEKVEGVQA